MTVVDVFGEKDFILELSSLCNNGTDPTERALLGAAAEHGLEKGRLEKNHPRVSEIPFDSGRKLMTTIHRRGNGYRVITKGAPDVLLERCLVSPEKKRMLLTQNSEMARRALRVIGVAYALSLIHI